MYVPMFKTKKQELSVSKEMNHCFSSETIPLYEILTAMYKVRYKTDPKTSLEIREKKGVSSQAKCTFFRHKVYTSISLV